MFRPGIVPIKFILFIRIMTHCSCFLGIDPALLKSVSVFTLLTSLALVACSFTLVISLTDPKQSARPPPPRRRPREHHRTAVQLLSGIQVVETQCIQYSNLSRLAGSLDIILELYLHFLSYSCGNNMLHMKRQDDMI